VPERTAVQVAAILRAHGGWSPDERTLQRRVLTGYRWARREDTVRLEAALRNGLAAHGIPDSLYMDNGSAMIDKQLQRACACLGIRIVHSRPGQPRLTG